MVKVLRGIYHVSNEEPPKDLDLDRCLRRPNVFVDKIIEGL